MVRLRTALLKSWDGGAAAGAAEQQQRGGSKRAVREALAAGRVSVNGAVETDGHRQVTVFCRVELDGAAVMARVGRYVMLHKPAGVVSATTDAEHPTAVGCVRGECWSGELRLAGRLDRWTTGLLLLTNDCAWSLGFTCPHSPRKVGKVYAVGTAHELADLGGAVRLFEGGLQVPESGETMLPARLARLGPCLYRVTLFEGRNHQIKKMFNALGNRVTALHRESVGPLVLDPGLAPGEWRHLTQAEVDALRGDDTAVGGDEGVT